jgi:hypothetical protein
MEGEGEGRETEMAKDAGKQGGMEIQTDTMRDTKTEKPGDTY